MLLSHLIADQLIIHVIFFSMRKTGSLFVFKIKRHIIIQNIKIISIYHIRINLSKYCSESTLSDY